VRYVKKVSTLELTAPDSCLWPVVCGTLQRMKFWGRFFVSMLVTGVLGAQDLPEAPPHTDATARQLIELSWQAIGGREAVGAVTGLYVEGDWREGLHTETFKQWWLTPGRLRLERAHTPMGERLEILWATDGSVTWSQELLPERGRARILEGKAAYGLQAWADWRGATWSMDEPESPIFAYTGTKTFGDRSLHEVQSWDRAGKRLHRYYFDPERFLLVGYTYFDYLGGNAVRVMRWLGRWQKHAGVALPVQFRDEVNGRVLREITYQRVTVNPDAPTLDIFSPPKQREVWLRQSTP